ncbi:MAG: alpha/beta fold hydrolase [Gemmatimonadota bacterium]
MPTSTFEFTGSGGDRLSARIETPASGRPLAWALFAHCFTCSKNVRAAVHISRGLAQHGIGVLRFDFTGLGESEGDFANTNFSSNIDDLVRAAQALELEHGAPSILVGHSLGGAAVLRAAGRLPSVRAVATVGAPAEPLHVLGLLKDSTEEIEAAGEATVDIGGRPFRVQKQFVDDLQEQRTEHAVASLGRALMILHSPTDQIVGIENAAQLYEMARHPKSFVSLDGADHLLSRPEDATFVASVLAAWAARYVEPAPDLDGEQLTGSNRVITSTGSGTFYTEIGIRAHELVADEPKSVGGDDLGPTPYDYLLAGLGACTSMTLQMYAGRKGWPLEEARVHLRHSRLHGPDRDACEEDDECRLDVVDREVELKGPLDEGQRARLMEIADRCPVHRTLEAGVQVRTQERE